MIDVTKISDIAFDGIDHKDFPDFCDAYIEYATIMEKGKERYLTEEELDWIMEHEQDYFYEQLNNHLF